MTNFNELLQSAFAYYFTDRYLEATSNKYNFDKFRKDVAAAVRHVAYVSGQAAGPAGMPVG